MRRLAAVLLAALLAAAATLAAPRAARAQGGITDGTSNTIVLGERAVDQTDCRVGTTTDGTSNTLLIRAGTTTGCRLPIGPSVCTVGLLPIGGALDGTSNTVYVGEGAGTTCLVPLDPARCLVQTLPGITDGTSNTLLVGALLPVGAGRNCALPVGGANCTLGSITDGTSNTFLVGAGGSTGWCTLPVAGSGGLPDVRLGADGSPCLAGATQFPDGTSNTLLIGECAAVPPGATVAPEPATVALVGGGLLLLLLPARRRRAAAPNRGAP